jgi:hypothetical protein
LRDFITQILILIPQTEIKNARRRQGISPELPDIKDRERIKHEFLTTGTVK